MDNEKFQVRKYNSSAMETISSSPLYQMMLFKGNGSFTLDMTSYQFSGNTVIFFAPCQQFHWLGEENIEINNLSFHGDFYCIEYHKKEVACNGLLFNNIYQQPHITLPDDKYETLLNLLYSIEEETMSDSLYSDSILKSYLQLVLALCSREKSNQLHSVELELPFNSEIIKIQNLLDANFLKERSPNFYAQELALSSSAFTKKVKKFFGKSPIQLIQDKVILEAKKQLHLTRKSVKEIATELNFDDEFYFSRYFKKSVGISPAHFREDVGISIVAK